jgi:anti-sigma-K factor RskA
LKVCGQVTKLKDEKTTEEIQELAALYALGALCQHEALVFENHLLDGDSQTVAELESFSKVVEALGYSTATVDPPAYLLDVLKSRLHRESQNFPQTIQFPNRNPLAAHPEATGQTAVQPQGTSSYQNVSTFPEAKTGSRSTASTFIPWALAATLAIAAMIGFWLWKKETAALNSQIAVIQKETDQLNKKLNEENEKVFELARISQALRSPNARVIELAGQDVAPTSKANIYWDTNGNQWVVSADLPPAPEGKVYQLWFITSEGAVSAGLMKPNEKGHAFTVVDVPKNIGNLAASGITLEPAGGSAQPTMPIYAKGNVAG